MHLGLGYLHSVHLPAWCYHARAALRCVTLPLLVFTVLFTLMVTSHLI